MILGGVPVVLSAKPVLKVGLSGTVRGWDYRAWGGFAARGWDGFMAAWNDFAVPDLGAEAYQTRASVDARLSLRNTVRFKAAVGVTSEVKKAKAAKKAKKTGLPAKKVEEKGSFELSAGVYGDLTLVGAELPFRFDVSLEPRDSSLGTYEAAWDVDQLGSYLSDILSGELGLIVTIQAMTLVSKTLTFPLFSWTGFMPYWDAYGDTGSMIIGEE